MSVYKKGKNYFIDYYVGPKRYREMVGPNRREAEAALGKRLGEIREGRFFDRKEYPSVTVEELAERFLEWAKVKPLSETKGRTTFSPGASRKLPQGTDGSVP